MRVRVLMSGSHPEYRLVLPVETVTNRISATMRAAIEHLGEWQERSQDDLDKNRPEHREAMTDIAAHGAFLWMVSANYTGRIEVLPSEQLTT
jgi:hypothetical protein